MQYESIYNQCVNLSIESTDESLHQLVRIYLSDNKEVRKTAKTALKKTKNRQIVFSIIDGMLKNETGDKENWLIQLGMSLSRKRYLKRYLQYIRQNNVEISQGMIKNVQVKPFSDGEKKEITDYIIENNDFDKRLISWAGKDNSTLILEKALYYSIDNGFSENLLELLANNDEYVDMLQDDLFKVVTQNPGNDFELLRYLDFSLDTNYEFLLSKNDLFDIYEILKNNKYRKEIINEESFLIRVSLAVCSCSVIKAEDWEEVKNLIEERVNELEDLANEKNFMSFLKDLRYFDSEFVEQQLIEIYKKTKLYTDEVLNILAAMKSQFAYREMISFMLTSENRKERYKYAVQLMRRYGENGTAIYSYAKDLGDERLLKTLDEVAGKFEVDLTVPEKKEMVAVESKKTIKVIPHDAIVSEYMYDVAKRINAKYFFASVGFVFSSGLKMLHPLFDLIMDNDGVIELVAGSLQNYQKDIKNNKIDKRTVIYLNRLIQVYGIKLYTYIESFYHGKFYIIANDEVEYVITGSSNISKTAYIDNYEFDTIVENEVGKDTQFRDWYNGFKEKCTLIEYLDIDKYDDLNWESELEIYNRRVVRKMTQSEVHQKIMELTDEETRFRLNLWLEHSPTEIYTDLSIPGLPEYY